ncbi:hypothetical protein SH467x_003417 [Pirellulaceae bacterium SH467]
MTKKFLRYTEHPEAFRTYREAESHYKSDRKPRYNNRAIFVVRSKPSPCSLRPDTGAQR